MSSGKSKWFQLLALVFIVVLALGCPSGGGDGDGSGEGEGQSEEGAGEGQPEEGAGEGQPEEGAGEGQPEEGAGEGEPAEGEGEPVVVGGFAPAPGLTVTVTSVTIPDEDLRPVVEFTMTDEDGNPVRLSEFAGTSDIRFVLGYLGEDTGSGRAPQFVNYITTIETYDPATENGTRTEAAEETQATYDHARKGGVTEYGDGTLTYKFESALPEDFNQSATHQLAGQLRRTSVLDGLRYVSNPIFRFRPDGGEVVNTRQIITTETCNQCHTRLSLHGGGRREVQYCIMCHTAQTVDANTGNSVDFPIMIHKIHRGADLQSVVGDPDADPPVEGVPYVIYGYGDNEHDWGKVEFPQDIRNCTKCHQDVTGGDGAPDADVWKERPSQSVCGSCHDRTSWDATVPAGMEAHPGGPQANDAMCAACHPASGAPNAITEAHLPPSLVGLDWAIAEVAVDAGTGAVAITFTVDDANGEPITDLASLNRVRAILTYPATDYTTRLYENPLADPLPEGSTLDTSGSATGTYVFTFEGVLPVDTDDTFAVALSGRIEADPDGVPDSGDEYMQGPAANSRVIFTADGSEPVDRRQIVSDEKCSKCHGEVRMYHAPRRIGHEICLMCHNPTMTGRVRNVEATELPQESKHFKRLIHEIHDAQVAFPGEVRQCSICHVDDSYELPVSADALPTMFPDSVTIDDVVYDLNDPDIQPAASACTACHDDLMTGFHALANTVTDPRTSELVETCVVCHGPSAEFDVSVVHDIGP